MKTVFVAVSVLWALILAPAAATADSPSQNGFSMGVVLGDPTGLTLRSGLDERNAIQASLGFSPFPGDAMAAVVDWTHDAWNFLRDTPDAALLFYFGVGGKAQWFLGNYYAYGNHQVFSDRSHFGLGVRGLVGLRASFANAPFDLFFEMVPLGLIFVVPDAGAYFDFDVALGGRYRF
jgi:hypothetical protein